MKTIVDVRSDTVTKPTKEMLQFMFEAKVGDDVFEEDIAVNELQQMAAEMFGFEDALFCPSGTMTNQIAIKLHTQPGDELICDKLAHIYNYEGGGIAFNSGVSTRLINSNNGIFSDEDVLDNINADNVHFPKTSLVCLENTVNKGGGVCWDIENMQKIATVCKINNLKLHLDGARVFNALIKLNQNPKQYGAIFDTISVCLSKGLGAPVGSLLLGSKQHIKQAKRIRKVLGGGMRQAGYLAAAGLFALKNNVQRLKADHLKVLAIKDTLMPLDYIESILPVETNIVIFKLKKHVNDSAFVNYLAENNIKAATMGKNSIRFVMHLDISDDDTACLIAALKKFKH